MTVTLAVELLSRAVLLETFMRYLKTEKLMLNSRASPTVVGRTGKKTRSVVYPTEMPAINGAFTT